MAQEINCALDPGGGGERFRHGCHGRHDLVLAQPVATRLERRSGARHGALIVVERDGLIEAVPVALRVEVGLADGQRLVSEGAQCRRQRPIAAEVMGRPCVMAQAMAQAGLAGHERGAAGHANRAIGVGAIEGDAVCRQPIEMWRAQESRLRRSAGIPALLVGGNEQDVRRGHGVKFFSGAGTPRLSCHRIDIKSPHAAFRRSSLRARRARDAAAHTGHSRRVPAAPDRHPASARSAWQDGGGIWRDHGALPTALPRRPARGIALAGRAHRAPGAWTWGGAGAVRASAPGSACAAANRFTASPSTSRPRRFPTLPGQGSSLDWCSIPDRAHWRARSLVPCSPARPTMRMAQAWPSAGRCWPRLRGGWPSRSPHRRRVRSGWRCAPGWLSACPSRSRARSSRAASACTLATSLDYSRACCQRLAAGRAASHPPRARGRNAARAGPWRRGDRRSLRVWQRRALHPQFPSTLRSHAVAVPARGASCRQLPPGNSRTGGEGIAYWGADEDLIRTACGFARRSGSRRCVGWRTTASHGWCARAGPSSAVRGLPMEGTRQRAAMTLQPVDLRCEHLVDPLGVEHPNPRLAWALRGARRGMRQSRVAGACRELGGAARAGGRRSVG